MTTRAPSTRSPLRQVSAPWLIASAAALVAAGLLATGVIPVPARDLAFFATHPLAALLCLASLALALAVAVRAWPRQATPATAVPARGGQRAAAPEWDALMRRARAALAQQGVAAAPSGQWAPGADMVLRQHGQPYLVSAKHWSDKVIGGTAVRELALDIARQRAAGGMLLSATQVYTTNARQLARQHGIALLGRTQAPATRPVHAPQPKPARQPASRPSAAAAAPKAVARAVPRLRDDKDVLGSRRSFAPTVPMGADELARVLPALRPDHEVAARRADFLPTVPMARGAFLAAAAGRAPT